MPTKLQRALTWLTNAGRSSAAQARTDMGLGNVDNTSDAAKPVSTATQAALDLKVDLSSVGEAGGVAELDSSGNPLNATGARRRLVLLGDSITAQGGGTASSIRWDSLGFWVHALIEAKQPLSMVRNSGVGGETSGAMLARHAADVAAYSPTVVHVLAGTNDVEQGVAADTCLSNITAICDANRAIGALTILGTVLPATGRTTDELSRWNTINQGIRKLGIARPDVLIADYASALTDPTTDGSPISGVLSDAVHPNANGARLMGRMLTALLTRVGQAFQIAPNGSSTENLLGNGPLTGSGTSVPTGWSTSGTAPTWSYVARTDGRAGNWAQAVQAAGATFNLQRNTSIGSTVAIGDTVTGYIEFEAESIESPAITGQSIRLQIQFYNGGALLSARHAAYSDGSYTGYTAPSSGILRVPSVVVPANTTTIAFVATIVGGGTYRLGPAAMLKGSGY